MAIAFSNLGASANPDINSSTDLSSYVNSSWTPPTSGLIFVFVHNRQVAATAALPTMSGNGLTWVQIATITFNADLGRITLFGADASGSSTGVTTVDFGGATQAGCAVQFAAITGEDLTQGVLAAFIQAPTTSGTASSGSIALSAAANAGNRPISGWYHAVSEGTTPRSNWTELDDNLQPGMGLETQYRGDAFETTASASGWTNSAFGGIAAEIAVAGSLNAAPNVPILVSPTSGSTADFGSVAGRTFDWTFSDPNAGDTQAGFYFRRKISGAGSYDYWNVGTLSWQSTEVFNAQLGDSFVFPAASWTNGNIYNWSVKTRDNGGLDGTYAADFVVTGGNPPTGTITAPAATVTTTTRPPVEWTYSDAENDLQRGYEVVIESGVYGVTPGAGINAWSSGEVFNGAARSATPTVDLLNGTTYRAFLRVSQAGPQYSSWTFVTFTLSLDPPAIPTISGAEEPATARNRIDVQGRDNMLSVNQASLETDTTGWEVDGNCAITRSITQALNGSASLQMTASAGGDMSARTTELTGMVVGRTYTALASFRKAAAGSRSVKVLIAWYDAASVLLSSSAGSAVTANEAGWTQALVTAAAPANAARARVIVQVEAAGAAEVWNVDQISLSPGSSTAWTRGGLIGIARFIVEYLDGSTWEIVRGASAVVPDANQQASVYDYEAPPKVARQYRAKNTVEV